ncbi:complement C1q-like protein 2 [Ruditapes philippinarum]|uniref:complement C1q-like protein 2 n=1 Tax=Ruditapes philippinarum TaxID=129788 RepID=UPI00295BA665|nr:complement C1q-like protein 2 [Ruditapes philippinarum]
MDENSSRDDFVAPTVPSNRRTSLSSSGGTPLSSTSTMSARRLSSSDAGEKSDYRRLQNEMQIMTFKVRALEEKVEKIVKEAGINLQNGPTGRGVAFTARLKEHVTVRSLETIKFDDVLTNIGKSYFPSTGVFKVPYSGRYLFSLTVRAQYQKQVCAEIIAEPHVIGQLAAGDSEIERASASITVVVSLQAGDEIYVRESKPWTGNLFGEGYTSFTGILLQ